MCNETRTLRRIPAWLRAGWWSGQVIALLTLSPTGYAMAQAAGSGIPQTPPAGPLPVTTPGQLPAVPGAPPPAAPAGEPLPPLPAIPGLDAPKVIETRPAARNAPKAAPRPIEGDVAGGGIKFQNTRRDSTGLLPNHPPGPVDPRDPDQVNRQVDDLVAHVVNPEAEISLVVNQTKVIETRRPLKRIAIASPRVADLELLSDQPDTRLLNLYGRSYGTTTITFWDADEKPTTFLVRVTLDALDLEKRIQQTFPGANVKVRQVGPQIILEGQVPDAKTMSEVLSIVNAELRLNATGMTGGAGGAGGAPPGGAGAGGGAATAAPPPGGQTTTSSTTTTTTSGTNVPQFIVINRVRVPGARQVMLHVKIAELNRTAIRQLGVSWLDPKNNAILASTIGAAGNITATGAATQAAATGVRGALSPIASTFNSTGAASPTSNAQLFGIFNAAQFSLFINALRSNSLAKVLAEPNLMTLDGQPARFLAGGLFPYPVPQSSSIPGGTAVVTVQFANFGAILSFLPNILQNDVIRLDVEPVFSQLNFGQGTTINGGVVPAIDQRSARTVVELREGQTLAIAGLLQTATNASTVRIPGLGDLPIVGPWFSNTQHEIVETELVVLVTPELVAPMEAAEVPPAPGDRVFSPNDYEFYFLGRIEGKLGREFRATVRELDPLDVMKHFQSENRWVIGPHGHSD